MKERERPSVAPSADPQQIPLELKAGGEGYENSRRCSRTVYTINIYFWSARGGLAGGRAPG